MSEKPGIVFFGTPEFAVPSLDVLFKNDFPIRAVVTAPDKPTGRGQKLASSPIKEYAEKYNIKILQPSNLKDENFIKELSSLNADLFMVVAFRKLPDVIWKMPPMGTVNLHASLLPHYRGAAPINWVIINGEKETGITTFFIEHDIDSGQIIFRDQTMIGKAETAGELHDRLMTAGAALVLKTVNAIQEKSYYLYNQNEMTHGKPIKQAPKLNKENTKIDLKMRPDQLCNFINGLSPYPGAYTQLTNKKGISFPLKIFSADPNSETHSNPAGRVLTDNKTYLNIYLPGGYISVKELQLSGRNRVKIKDYLNGLNMEGEWFIE